MIFKPELLAKILAGTKTQTRRPSDPKESVVWSGDPNGDDPSVTILAVYSADKKRVKYRVGKSYALQPGRGKPAPLVAALRTPDSIVRKIVTEHDGPFYYAMADPARIVITAIGHEDVRTISDEDAIAEGFKDRIGFLEVWCSFYDPKALRMHYEIRPLSVFEIVAKFDPEHRTGYLTDWSKRLFQRDQSKYQAWKLTIRPER